LARFRLRILLRRPRLIGDAGSNEGRLQSPKGLEQSAAGQPVGALGSVRERDE
jgi:hypothetical protein